MKRPILDGRKIRLNQTAVGRSGKIVLETTNLQKSFGERTLLQEVNIHIFYQDSACIIGENGSGKTTLLKMILGDLEPDQGNIKIGSQISIGYLPQQVEYKDEEQTVLEYFSDLHNITYGAARSQLAKVLFMNEDVNKKIKFLSGGEKSRLKLCSLTFTGVNFLILDEPTNHLDIDSREVLEETLSEFEGTLLFVSHDRYFINKIADKIIAVEEGSIKEYNGDYAYYQEESVKARGAKEAKEMKEVKDVKAIKDEKQKDSHKNMRITAEAAEASPSALWKELKPSSIKAKKPSRKLEFLEKCIDEMEEKLKHIQELMTLYNTDGCRLSELFAEKEKLEQELETAYFEWEAIQ
jgi:ABC-type multidrug transport system ATPase subunit